jgi:thiol-disulfide isomerase/thioredoxin
MLKVGYLEADDITIDGHLKPHVTRGQPVVVMVKAEWCHYCVSASPAFQEVANMDSKIRFCCIQKDGSASQKQAAEFVKVWDPSVRGVPGYFLFDKNGVYMNTYNGGRDAKSIITYANNMLL